MRQEEPSGDELVAEWQAIDSLRRQAAGPLFRDLRQMFRAQADRAERVMEANEWRLPEALPEQRQEEDEPEDTGPPLVLRAENIFSLSVLTKEVKGALSGLTDQEAARLARELGVDEDEIAEYLEAGNTENLIRAGFEAAVQRLDADTNFVPSDPDVQQAITDLNSQARGIAGTTLREVNDEIREGVAASESVEEVQGRVTSALRGMADGDDDPDTDISQSRARRIASTTTTTAFERGQDRAFEEVGMFGRMWLSQRDVHVRRGHLEADGQQRRMGEPFDVAPDIGRAEEELAFPGDPTGSPANVINCRCTALPIPDRETFESMGEEEPSLSNLPQMSNE